MRISDWSSDVCSSDLSIAVKELCELYIKELEQGRILGKGGRPKKTSTKSTDLGRINRHIIPLIGKMLVTRLTKADVTTMMKDIMAGKKRQSERSEEHTSELQSLMRNSYAALCM